MSHRGLILLAACALSACASGPHPALRIASKDLDCEQSGLKLHQIYPKKVRIEGCGREAIYVDACSGYGMDQKCGWGRQYANAFERDVAEREKAERAEAKEHKAEDDAAAKREKEEQDKADQPKPEEAKSTAKKSGEEKSDDDQASSAKADEPKPERKSAKPKASKKDDSLDSFLKK